MIGRGKRTVWFLMAVGCLATVVLCAFPSGNVYAAQITARTLTLQARGAVGGSTPDGVVNHQFTFTIPSSGNLGSIKFLYCTTATATDPCIIPTGLTTASATLGTSLIAVFTSAVSTSANSIYISRTMASFAGGAVTEQLLSVHNPTATNQPFYVRISTYASTDATGTAIDTGSVAAATSTQIALTGYMPESLIFCAGAAVSKTGGVPDCSTATAGNIHFNQSFSPADTATAQSQMSASTNANSGYSITVNGPTLTSGSNTVTAMAAKGAGVRGTSQFGLNTSINTTGTSTPAIPIGVTLPVDPVANGSNYRGQVDSDYSTVDQFRFVSGAEVVNSNSLPTDSQIYTVSYIVNVNGAQPVGTYVTTLSYICTANF